MGQLLWQEKIDRWSRFDQFPSPPQPHIASPLAPGLPLGIAASRIPLTRRILMHPIPFSFLCAFSATAFGQRLYAYVNVRVGDPVKNMLTPLLWREKKGQDVVHENRAAPGRQ